MSDSEYDVENAGFCFDRNSLFSYFTVLKSGVNTVIGNIESCSGWGSLSKRRFPCLDETFAVVTKELDHVFFKLKLNGN